MSAIFSDPTFRRGSTLLGGETIETDANGPIAGREIVGQVKIFQDVVPTGKGERKSNRLVYCVAARYTGSTVSDATTVAGKVMKFAASSPLTEVDGTEAVNGDVHEVAVGVVDEYLAGELRQNDIIWLVVKGPTTVKKAAATAIGDGVAVEVTGTDGLIQAQASGNVLGQHIGDDQAPKTVGAGEGVRVNLHCNFI
jgi:hypothetical protein